ncbi:hypothetical protein T4A_13265, partial [Trichinella pseudospiralis]
MNNKVFEFFIRNTSRAVTTFFILIKKGGKCGKIEFSNTKKYCKR